MFFQPRGNISRLLGNDNDILIEETPEDDIVPRAISDIVVGNISHGIDTSDTTETETETETTQIAVNGAPQSFPHGQSQSSQSSRTSQSQAQTATTANGITRATTTNQVHETPPRPNRHLISPPTPIGSPTRLSPTPLLSDDTEEDIDIDTAGSGTNVTNRTSVTNGTNGSNLTNNLNASQLSQISQISQISRTSQTITTQTATMATGTFETIDSATMEAADTGVIDTNARGLDSPPQQRQQQRREHNETNSNSNNNDNIESVRASPPQFESPARQRRARRNLTTLERLHYSDDVPGDCVNILSHGRRKIYPNNTPGRDTSIHEHEQGDKEETDRLNSLHLLNYQLADWLPDLDDLRYKQMSDLEHTILFPSYMHKSPNKNKNKTEMDLIKRRKNKNKNNSIIDKSKYENTYLKCVLTLENHLLKLSKLPNNIFDNLLYLPYNTISPHGSSSHVNGTNGNSRNGGNGSAGHGNDLRCNMHDQLCPWRKISIQFYQSQTQFSNQTALPSPGQGKNEDNVLSIFEIFCRLYINEITVINNTIAFLRIIGQNLMRIGNGNMITIQNGTTKSRNKNKNKNKNTGDNSFGLDLMHNSNDDEDEDENVDDEKDFYDKERENDELIENGILKLKQSECCCDKITTLQLSKYDFLHTPSRIFNGKKSQQQKQQLQQQQYFSYPSYSRDNMDDIFTNEPKTPRIPNKHKYKNKFENFAPPDMATNININQHFSLTPLKKSSQALLCSTRKFHRKIGKSPFKVLDAPKLIDDFYLNLVDWSKKNVLSVALGENVYLWSARTSHVTKLCDLTQVLIENGDNMVNGHHHNGYNMVCSVAWSNKGEKLAVGSGAGHVLIYDTHKQKLLQRLTRHGHRVGVLAWKNSKIVASGSRDRFIWIHDTRCNDQHSHSNDTNSGSLSGSNGKDVVHVLGFHKQEVCGLEWNDDRTYLGSGGNDNRLSIWDIRYPRIPHCYGRHRAAVKAIAWSPHERGLIATGGGTADRCIRFWNINSVPPLQYDGVRPGYPIPETNISTGLLDVRSNNVALMKPLRTIDTGSQVCNLLWSKNVNEIVSTHGYSLNQIVVWRYPAMDKVKLICFECLNAECAFHCFVVF